MHEIKCTDCGKHLGFYDCVDGYDSHYCDGCAYIKGEKDALKFIPTIIIDEETNVSSHIITE